MFSQVHPIFMLSVADFILAICWLLGGVLWLQTKASHYFGFCYFLAIVTVVSTWIHTQHHIHNTIYTTPYYTQHHIIHNTIYTTPYLLSFCFHVVQIAEMITFLLTMIYALTPLLRVVEVYQNEGSLLSPQVSCDVSDSWGMIVSYRIRGRSQDISSRSLLI